MKWVVEIVKEVVGRKGKLMRREVLCKVYANAGVGYTNNEEKMMHLVFFPFFGLF
jgi:hypothetical protein